MLPMKKVQPIETDYISLEVLAKKVGQDVSDLLMAIHDHQVPVCIKLSAWVASAVTERHREENINVSARNLLPDVSLFPAELPPHVGIPIDSDVLGLMTRSSILPPRVYQVAFLENGKFVIYGCYHISLHMSSLSVILLKEHANQLLRLLSKGAGFDDPLTQRERGNMLRTVGALVDILLQSHAGGGTEEAVIRDIIETYPNTPGLSRSNLQKLFAQSKRALDREEQATPIPLL